jgi:hypothetical protein
MQMSVIEFARNKVGLTGAHSTEMDASTQFPVIDLMEGQKNITNKGGTMRLGAYPCKIEKDSLERKKEEEEANKKWSVGAPPEWPENNNEVPTAPPPPPPKELSLGTNINEYDSPSKTIEQEVDDLNQKPLNSLDRLNRKYGTPDS